MHAELDDIFADDPERAVTMKDLAEMKYLECCIKEALRLYPSVPAFARTLREDVQIAHYTIPAGTTAMLVIYMLHRNPEVSTLQCRARWPPASSPRPRQQDTTRLQTVPSIADDAGLVWDSREVSNHPSYGSRRSIDLGTKRAI